MTHDVSLPVAQTPSFPDRCVSCEKPHPGDAAELSVTGAGSSPGFTESAINAALGSSMRGSNITITLQVPACTRCAKALQSRHRWKTFWLYFGALGGVCLMFITLTYVESVWLGLIWIAIGVLGPVIWELRHPPGFTFTPMPSSVSYEFRSELCASEFRDLNGVPKPQSDA